MNIETPKRYALITGASEGFGKALALECASRNWNLILVALPGPDLFYLSAFIRKNFSVDVHCIEADLSKPENCEQVFDEVKALGLSLNILINNAGIGGTHFFEEKNAVDYERQIQLNVTAPTMLTRLFLENLIQSAPAHILNVSSLASFFNLPKKQVYGGTKSYLLSFSKSLRHELKRSRVHVSVLCPGGMNTTPALTLSNKTGTWISQWSIMNPEMVATIAIDQMLQRKAVIIPGKWNQFFLAIDKILPQALKEKLIDLQMGKYRTKVLPRPALQLVQSSHSIHTLKTSI